MRFCPACGARLGTLPPVTCARCGHAQWRNAKPCAGALATRNGRLLLMRRAHEPWFGRWDIPGGFCEADEHPVETAVREVREETGLEIQVTGFLGMWLDTYPDPGVAPGWETVTLNAYYCAEVVGGEERPDPRECSELGWFAPGSLPREIAFPAHAGRVLAAWEQAVGEGATRTPLWDRRSS